MELSQGEALAILSKLKGSNVYFRLRRAHALRVSCDAKLDRCDEHGVQLTWPSNGSLYVGLEGATFKRPNQNKTGLAGLEIALDGGIKCVVCPSRLSG